MLRIFSIYQNKLIIYNNKTQPSQNAILSLIKNQLGVKSIIEDSSTSKVYLNKNGELIVRSIEYRLDTDLGTPLYTFGLLSDTHVDNDGTDKASSISDLNNAIKFFNDEGCEFIAYCGDMTEDGRDVDFTALKSCLDTSTIPNYTIRGNHDCNNTVDVYKNATGMEQDYTITKNNDLFVFLSLDNDANIGTRGGLTQEKVDWLTNIINTSNHQRIFLFYHFFFRNTSGDGVGGSYPHTTIGDGTLTSYAQDFVNLVNNTPNLIFCTGHSHFKFNLQDKNPNANYYHTNNSCYHIHVPGGSRPRTVNTSGGTENLYADSEGYLVEVYADKVLFKPRNFISNEYLLQYAYIVEL